MSGAPEPDLQSLGLSYTPITARKGVTVTDPHAVLWEDGGLISVVKGDVRIPPSGADPDVRPAAPSRGKVRKFTRPSQLRLMRMLGKVKRDQVPLFVTLTYPSWASPDPDEYRRHLRRFESRMRRRWPRMSAVWKLEFQKNGTPHTHLLVWGVSHIPRLWLSRAWYECVGISDPRADRHLAAGTSVETARTSETARRYLSKYVWKRGHATALEGFTGRRFWGVWGSEYMPWATPKAVPLPSWAVNRMMRYARRFIGARPRQYPRLSVSTCDPGQWERLMAYVLAHPPPGVEASTG